MAPRLLLLVGLTWVAHLAEAACPSVCMCIKIGNFLDRVEVDCQNKNITSVPESLSPQAYLLKLNGNRITALQANAFKTENTNNLRLQFNIIATVHKDAFKNLKHLQTLKLDNNKINSLDPETFRYNAELKTISLGHNPLTRLEDGLFTNMSQLSSVGVENCKLSYIGPKTFVNVPKLYYLHLNGNNLVQVDFMAMLPVNGLRMVLNNNPWKCDCKVKHVRDFIAKKASASDVEWYKAHSPSCAQPPRLANKTWMETKPEDFIC